LIYHALEGYATLLIALALLVVSFFAKIPQGVRWAVFVLVATFVQIALGALSHMLAAIGALHGAAALILFGRRRHGSHAGAQAGRRRGAGDSAGRLNDQPPAGQLSRFSAQGHE
jgi:heme A synthase